MPTRQGAQAWALEGGLFVGQLAGRERSKNGRRFLISIGCSGKIPFKPTTYDRQGGEQYGALRRGLSVLSRSRSIYRSEGFAGIFTLARLRCMVQFNNFAYLCRRVNTPRCTTLIG